jgi:hypothetical protein
LNHHDVQLAAECYQKSQDLGGLLLLAASSGDEEVSFTFCDSK